MAYAVFSLIDASNEVTSVTVNLGDIAGDGSNYAAILTAMTDAQAQIEAITDGTVKERTLVASRERLTNVIPSDNSARESKWVIRYQDDDTLKVHVMEIGNANRSLLPMNAASDFVDVNNSSNATWTAFLAWFNDDVVSPAGNEVTLLTMEHTGARL